MHVEDSKHDGLNAHHNGALPIAQCVARGLPRSSKDHRTLQLEGILTGRFRFAVSSLVLALGSACDKIPALPKRKPPAEPKATAPAAKIADTAKSAIELSLGSPYTVADLTSFGSVAGTLHVVDSAAFGDSAAVAVPECSPR